MARSAVSMTDRRLQLAGEMRPVEQPAGSQLAVTHGATIVSSSVGDGSLQRGDSAVDNNETITVYRYFLASAFRVKTQSHSPQEEAGAGLASLDVTFALKIGFQVDNDSDDLCQVIGRGMVQESRY